LTGPCAAFLFYLLCHFLHPVQKQKGQEYLDRQVLLSDLLGLGFNNLKKSLVQLAAISIAEFGSIYVKKKFLSRANILFSYEVLMCRTLCNCVKNQASMAMSGSSFPASRWASTMPIMAKHSMSRYLAACFSNSKEQSAGKSSSASLKIR
jgi:hypothetical protein